MAGQQRQKKTQLPKKAFKNGQGQTNAGSSQYHDGLSGSDPLFGPLGVGGTIGQLHGQGIAIGKRARAYHDSSSGTGATMLTLPDSVRVYVCTVATDMRRGADGLSAMVMGVLRQQPQSGHVFVFFNKTRCIVRILFWDGDGYWLLSKRLEYGRFRKLVPDGDPPAVTMSAQELIQLLRAGQAKRLVTAPSSDPILH